ncbi:hypothetical protein C4K03_2255 [Pseudomonas synxantha]|uniref:Uncharacterized protein n=1 Tax=Pseudomonas synxantha TaxID=47883 RepID=A0A3G7U5F0_9PSED|nr:hypothetical protein C4K03_2255 [Pseudomonas synxantha]
MGFLQLFEVHIRLVIGSVMTKINEWIPLEQAPHVWLDEPGSSLRTPNTNDNM